MTLNLDAKSRATRDELRRKIRALEGPVKAIRKAAQRKAREERAKALVRVHGQRQPRERDNGYLAFLRRQPCAVASSECLGPVEACHIRYADAARGKPATGMQKKPDDKYAAPLCAGHHRLNPGAQHNVNERGFWAAHGIDALALAEKLYVQYLKAGA